MTPEEYVELRDRVALLKARTSALSLRFGKMGPTVSSVHVPTAMGSQPKKKSKKRKGRYTSADKDAPGKVVPTY